MSAWLRRMARAIGHALLAWAEGPLAPMSAAQSFQWHDTRETEIAAMLSVQSAVHSAVRLAMTIDCGLPPEAFTSAFDLQRTGKLQEVIYHAAQRLEIDPGLRTVGHVLALLERAQANALQLGDPCQPLPLASSSSAPTSRASSPASPPGRATQ